MKKKNKKKKQKKTTFDSDLRARTASLRSSSKVEDWTRSQSLSIYKENILDFSSIIDKEKINIYK